MSFINQQNSSLSATGLRGLHSGHLSTQKLDDLTGITGRGGRTFDRNNYKRPSFSEGKT
jgi:hypothetical protein